MLLASVANFDYSKCLRWLLVYMLYSTQRFNTSWKYGAICDFSFFFSLSLWILCKYVFAYWCCMQFFNIWHHRWNCTKTKSVGKANIDRMEAIFCLSTQLHRSEAILEIWVFPTDKWNVNVTCAVNTNLIHMCAWITYIFFRLPNSSIFFCSDSQIQ